MKLKRLQTQTVKIFGGPSVWLVTLYFKEVAPFKEYRNFDTTYSLS